MFNFETFEFIVYEQQPDIRYFVMQLAFTAGQHIIAHMHVYFYLFNFSR